VGRTSIKAQEAKARARTARLKLLVERTAQDERIEDAAAVALLAWQDRSAAQAQVEKAERAVAAALVLLGREKVLVREMAALTGIGESACARLLRSPVAPAKRDSDSPSQAPSPGEGSRVGAAG
jgi:type II secretory pathway predicted ATPase ExeA